MTVGAIYELACPRFHHGYHQVHALVHSTITTVCLRLILYLSHGAGEHMGRYEKLKDELVESGMLVYGHDHGELASRAGTPACWFCNPCCQYAEAS